MLEAFLLYTRCQKELLDVAAVSTLADPAGFFRYGDDLILFGRTASGRVTGNAGGSLNDVKPQVRIEDASVLLPFDPGETMDNLRLERYADSTIRSGSNGWKENALVRRIYYMLRPMFPVAFRKHLQRVALREWDQIHFPTAPVDLTVDRLVRRLWALLLESRGEDKIPFIWFWPEGNSGCCIMTHDVETARGRDFCSDLIDLEAEYGVRSSFEVVPEERYEVPDAYLEEIRNRGNEVCVHGLNHDGRLFESEVILRERARKMNGYGRNFGAAGFRSPVMYRNPMWLDALDFEYDMSIPNVGHLEAQRGGCCTVMPYLIGDLVELPLTTIQDYSLFHILSDYSIDLWKKQIGLIAGQHGLISFIVHPDYIIDDRPRSVYRELLEYMVGYSAENNIWMALPGEVSSWWKKRSCMELVEVDGVFRIEGDGSDQARIAYASREGDRTVYTLDN